MNTIDAVAETRMKAARAVANSLANARGKSEKELSDLISINIGKNADLYAEGWYSPPPAGISVLIGKERMGFDSLRKPEYWPRTDIWYANDIPAMIYVSPVDRTTRMIGDFGVSVYQGSDPMMQDHFKRGLKAIMNLAERARVGMSFSDLHAIGVETLALYGFEHARISTITANAGESNFGHTVPWSNGEAAPIDMPMSELQERIRIARRFINSTEEYVIARTCACTVESRLVDPKRPELPNIFFHVIVTFSEGEKKILSNFTDLFKTLGMDYML